MPTDHIVVDRVDWTLLDGGYRRYLVTGTHADGRLGGFTATTTSSWAASLCQRAKETQQPVLIQWMGFPHGYCRIMRVEPVNPQEQSA